MRDLKEYDIESFIKNLADFEAEGDFLNLSSGVASIFIVATYGDGDPPDSVQPFYDWAREDAQNLHTLQELHYCIFGLGNSTYEKFNQFAKDLDQILQTAGAHALYPLQLGDDDQHLEEDFVEWKEGLITKLCSFLGKRAVKSTKRSRIYSISESTCTLAEIVDSHPHTASSGRLVSHPALGNQGVAYVSSLVERKSLQLAGERTFLRCELAITDAIRYSAGDHVAILPSNPSELVARLARRLRMQDGELDKIFEMIPLASNERGKEEASPLPSPCSYRLAFSHYLDISQPPQHNIVAAMADFARDEQQRGALLSLLQDKVQFEAQIKGPRRNLVEVLEQFDSVEMPMDYLIELLPRLQWRYYSVSSSPRQSPDRIAITLSVLKYQTIPDLPERHGVATTWLESLPPRGAVPIAIRSSTFHLPDSHAAPIIMVGPGTGIAPFMGFLEERRWARSRGEQLGEAILFFGCRRRGEDFIYSQELERYREEGCLTELAVAFSRDQPHKVYVQHLMLERGERLERLIQEGGAFIYVCGDAKNMARDVHRTILQIVQEHGGHESERALEIVAALKRSGRYLEDVWS